MHTDKEKTSRTENSPKKMLVECTPPKAVFSQNYSLGVNSRRFLNLHLSKPVSFGYISMHLFYHIIMFPFSKNVS